MSEKIEVFSAISYFIFIYLFSLFFFQSWMNIYYNKYILKFKVAEKSEPKIDTCCIKATLKVFLTRQTLFMTCIPTVPLIFLFRTKQSL